MKKSDFIRSREKKWKECPNPHTASQWRVLVERDVQAVEAAGVVWDDPIPLPVSLDFSDDYFIMYKGLVICCSNPRWEEHNDVDRRAVLEELVRRYNEWLGTIARTIQSE